MYYLAFSFLIPNLNFRFNLHFRMNVPSADPPQLIIHPLFYPLRINFEVFDNFKFKIIAKEPRILICGNFKTVGSTDTYILS
jgi:hypothetical protein